jgi:hypothetical protein
MDRRRFLRFGAEAGVGLALHWLASALRGGSSAAAAIVIAQ